MRGVGRLKSCLERHRVAMVHKRHREANSADYVEIDRVIERYRAGGGLRHPFQAYKLFALRETLERYRPRSILELGAGTTTAIFVRYVNKSAGARLTVVDENEKWLRNAMATAQISGEEGRIALHVACKVEDPSFPATRYESVPEGDYDFVLIDGPSLSISGAKNKAAVNTNIIDVVDQCYPKTILIDIRKATVEYLDRVAHDKYKSDISDVIRRKITDGYRYFSIFERRHAELVSSHM